jgi:hypothetical protein
MNLATRIDYARLIERVALKLLGEPNAGLSKPPRDVRFGSHGSMAVNFEEGKWFDHENQIGGGVLDLIKHKTGRNHGEAQAWLRREGICSSPSNASYPAPHLDSAVKAIRKAIVSYDYADERGELLFQVVRYEPKEFRQRRPNGNGGWEWSLGDVRRVLYRLPDLAPAIQRGDTIYIVEGEKDADALLDNSMHATCNPGGAGKWRVEYSEMLRGVDAVVIPDHDESGRRHAEQVAAALHGLARRVRVLDLAILWPECPPKGDVSDWLLSHTASNLRVFADALPDWKPPAEVILVANVASVASEWPLIDPAAFHGLAGEVVHTIEPHSEADPVAILLQILVVVGNVIGRLPFYQIESDQHHSNLFAVLVGASAKARKGTSMGRVRAVTRVADENWHADRIKGGLSSGEGLIAEVRDEVRTWDAKEQQHHITDPGVADKRLLIVEPEFAAVLGVADRPGNTISALVRRAWDGDKLATLTKNSSLTATEAHVSIIGHITEDELRSRITRTDLANGFANRFLFALIRRSKELPFGGDLTDSEILHLGERLKSAIEWAKTAGRVTMTDAAKVTWAAVYGALSAGQPGLLGAVTARAEAQTIRLALIYALLDGAAEIDEPHLRAALAVWEYCETSAAHIFGNTLGDPVADEIEQELKRQFPEGMTRTAIRDLFGRHRTTDRIGAALALLLAKNRARVEAAATGGRPVETWFASSRG